MPKVSVIIPVFNTEKYLRKCLDSVCNQTLSDIEIICVDDCSTDNSLNILKEYASKDNRIKLIEFKENKGAAVARNTGIIEAKGEYVGFIDSDDYVDLDFYEKLYNIGVCENADISKGNLKWKFPDTILNDMILKDKNSFYYGFTSAIFKLELLINNNIKYPAILDTEDLIFTLKSALLANKITVDSTAIYNVVMRPDSQTRALPSKKRLDDRLYGLNIIIKMINKHNLSKETYSFIAFNLIKGIYFSLLKINDISLKEFYVSELLTIIDNVLYKETFYEKLETDSTLLYKYFKSKNVNSLVDLSEADINKYNVITKLRSKIKNKISDQPIPKRIFYVWGANEAIRPDVQKYINSWESNMPDFEIIQVDENSKYFDYEKAINENKWFKTVYERKMWAYVADYIRIKVLYEHGGIYLDTDVEVLQSLEKFLNAPAFVGIQDSSLDGCFNYVEPAILGSKKNNPFLKNVMSFYENLIWETPIYTMPQIFDFYLKNFNIYPFPPKKEQKIIKLENLTIYPEKYFIPYRYNTKFNESDITDDTFTIHHWGGSWVKPQIAHFLDNKHLTSIEEIDNTYKQNKTKIHIMYRAKKLLDNKIKK